MKPELRSGYRDYMERFTLHVRMTKHCNADCSYCSSWQEAPDQYMRTPDFARAVDAAGLIFVGPPASAIDAMGSKSAAKALMDAAGVPLVPGYHGADQALETFRVEAAKIGYPVLLKAAAGGGGKGMKVVESGSRRLVGVSTRVWRAWPLKPRRCAQTSPMPVSVVTSSHNTSA